MTEWIYYAILEPSHDHIFLEGQNTPFYQNNEECAGKESIITFEIDPSGSCMQVMVDSG